MLDHSSISRRASVGDFPVSASSSHSTAALGLIAIVWAALAGLSLIKKKD